MKTWLLACGMLGIWLVAANTPLRAALPPATAPSAVSSTAPAAPVAPSAATAQTAAVVVLSGNVDELSRDELFKRFAAARRLNVGVVILQIDTYGGLVTSGLEISQFLKRQNDLHVIAYVPDKAISAGAMIALACNEIVMGPGAVLGDSAPIAVSPITQTLQPVPAAERAKIQSPILEEFRDSAERNGYDVALCESMVAVGREIHWIQNSTGERRFVSADEYQKLMKTGGWSLVAGVRDPINAADSLLTVHTDLAIKLGLAKAQASSAQALAAQRGYQIAGTFVPGIGEKLVAWMGSYFVRFLVLVIFLISLYVALHVPGHGAAEAIAVLSLGMLLGVPLLTGYAQWWEIIVIFVGLALVAFEVFVFPGHFVSGAIGVLMVFGGFLMTFVPKEPGGMPGFVPHLQTTWSSITGGLLVVVGGLIASMLLWWWLNRYLPKLPYFNRLILTEIAGGDASAAGDRLVPGLDKAIDFPTVGAVGRALTDLRPGGTAEFYDDVTGDTRSADVVCESGFVRANAKVQVRECRGGYVLVKVIQA